MLTLAAPAGAGAAKRRGVVAKIMTRNVYLGSSLAAGLDAGSVPELCDGAGQILHEVDATRPADRMRAIANEIRNKLPDLVGMQEVAGWYTQSPGDGRPPQVLGGSGTFATTVRHDFLQQILSRLNQGKRRYKVIAVSNEFEFESETDLDGNNGTDSPGPDCTDSEIDGRLLMRDVILARLKAGVRTSNRRTGNFENQLSLPLAGGFPFAVKRGWESVNVSVRGSRKFRFVNTHLEAFDSAATGNDMFNTQTMTTTQVARGTVRSTQAGELVGAGGPANTALPVVLVGDLNSNVPEVQVGDGQAFQAVLDAGFKRRSTQRPPSCCLNDPTLLGGSLTDFDHVVDHILANKRRIRRIRSSVVGRGPVGGIYPSDHAGVFSVILLPR
jgi:endonuclease/exonuclease/phosphatase family metal-dependent hydrolase